MEKFDEALDAEWLSPDDLVELEDEEPPRISHIRDLHGPFAPTEIVSVELPPAETRPKLDVVEVPPAESPAIFDVVEVRPAEPPAKLDAADGMSAEASSSADRSSPMSHTLAGLGRLALFFLVGLGLGSIFALGVATALEIRRIPAERVPASIDPSAPAIDTSAGAPELGEPGPPL